MSNTFTIRNETDGSILGTDSWSDAADYVRSHDDHDVSVWAPWTSEDGSSGHWVVLATSVHKAQRRIPGTLWQDCEA